MMWEAVTKNLDCIRRNILWEGNIVEKKMHLMKWIRVIKPKVAGVWVGESGIQKLCIIRKVRVEVWVRKIMHCGGG